MEKMSKEIKVLDKGFVRLVDSMGSDAAVVQAARVSYGDGTKSVREDRALIRYLLRNKHMSPFEMCEIKFHIKLPMDVMRQLVRHRTANLNEYSTRYSIAIDDTLEASEWRLQSSDNKQGSNGTLVGDAVKTLSEKERQLHLLSKNIYRQRLDLGVAREQARKDLPLCTYTEAYWKMDLRNLLHFLKLRMDKHAQLEIREYANAIAEIVKELFPLTWEAFEDYELNAITFYPNELKILKEFLESKEQLINAINNNMSKTEINEFINKLEKMEIL